MPDLSLDPLVPCAVLPTWLLLIFLPVTIYYFVLNLINGPPGMLTPSQCFLEVL